MKTIIYAICCPSTEKIVYVGRTENPLENRLKQHLCSPVNDRMRAWLESLSGVVPLIKELESIDSLDAPHCEMYWIKQCRQKGFDLLNEISPLSDDNYEKSPMRIKSDKLLSRFKGQIKTYAPTNTIEEELVTEMIAKFLELQEKANELDHIKRHIESVYEEMLSIDGFKNKKTGKVNFYVTGQFWDISIDTDNDGSPSPKATVTRVKEIQLSE